MPKADLAPAQPEELAEVVLFLASDDASAVTARFFRDGRVQRDASAELSVTVFVAESAVRLRPPA